MTKRVEAFKRDLNICISSLSIYEQIAVFGDEKRLTRQKSEESVCIYVHTHTLRINMQ
jgi:hypothetical protein